MNPAMLRELLIFAAVMAALGMASKIVMTMVRRPAQNALHMETQQQYREILQRLASLEEEMRNAGLEIERIGEAHRFTARLLIDRESPPAT